MLKGEELLIAERSAQTGELGQQQPREAEAERARGSAAGKGQPRCQHSLRDVSAEQPL